MEGDLYVCGFGLIVTVTGGLVSVAGYHPAWQSIHDNTPAPTFGTILAIAGLFLVAIGIILMVVNIIVWLGGRHKGDVSESAPEASEERSWTCMRGHSQATSGPTISEANNRKMECAECGRDTSLQQGAASGGLMCVASGGLAGIAWWLGGDVALVVGGLALLVFLVGLWTVTLAGGFLFLSWLSDRGTRRRNAYRSRRRGRNGAAYRHLR